MFAVVKKSAVIIFAVIIIAIIVCSVALAVGLHSAKDAQATKKLLPIYGVDREDNKVALTFDAAWGGDKTEKILDILDEYDVKATFFLVGFWVDKYPDLVKEIAERGHLIGNHSDNHPHFNELSDSETAKEVTSCAEKITKITGATVRYFRAPYGEYNDRLISYLNGTDVMCIQWTADSLDWKGISGGEIATRVLNKVKSGGIILCHNNSDHILDALPLILLGLKNKGLQPVRIDELIYNENYYVDNNGIQIATSEKRNA